MDTRFAPELDHELATASFDRSGRHLTVYLAGELDASSAPAVTDAILEHIGPDDEHLSLELSALTFCDSSGLMMVFRLHELAAGAGVRFVLFQPSPPVRRVLDICDPNGVLKIRS